MTAWGSFALEVPSRNLRSLSLVSCEKVYSRDSDAWSWSQECLISETGRRMYHNELLYGDFDRKSNYFRKYLNLY
jgi:hypothetical protein